LLEPSNKTALITGASSGLGAEFAVQLAERGYNLILVARREDRLRELGDTLQSKYGVMSFPLALDLSQYDDIDKLINVAIENTNIEILVNNAGFGTVGRFFRVDPIKELAMLNVHMIAPVMLCRAILPGMISRNKGSIINVSSLAGIMPIRSVLYGSSKSFLIIFSEALQDEVRDDQVHVQALCPGFFLSEFHDTKEYTRFSRSSIPRFLWMSSQQVVKESLESLPKQSVICIPGNFYKFAGALARNSFTSGLIKAVARSVLRKRKL
jgi:short-subunit dehydrogenase